MEDLEGRGTGREREKGGMDESVGDDNLSISCAFIFWIAC
jgi:hypothetical protein